MATKKKKVNSGLINNCFKDDSPKFYKEVIEDGVNYGTIRVLTGEDLDIIQRKSGMKFVEGKDKKLKQEIESIDSFRNYRILLSLGGDLKGRSFKHGDEGWNLDRDLTIESINLLYDDTKEIFEKAITNLDESWKDKKAIAKN